MKEKHINHLDELRIRSLFAIKIILKSIKIILERPKFVVKKTSGKIFHNAR